MRKAIVAMLVLGMVASLAAAPAIAGKKKKTKVVTEEWTATAVPGPFDPTVPAFAGACPEFAVEGVQRISHPFTAPGTGALDVSMTGFEGDWDLYLLDSAGAVVGQSTGFVDATTERVIYTAKKGQEFNILACNFIGSPQASLTLTHTYKG